MKENRMRHAFAEGDRDAWPMLREVVKTLNIKVKLPGNQLMLHVCYYTSVTGKSPEGGGGRIFGLALYLH